MQENHNILSKLSPDEYKQVLGNMKHCILATDLALFFPNKTRLLEVVETDSFDWNNPEHRWVAVILYLIYIFLERLDILISNFLTHTRLLMEALFLTGADLCPATKPWDVQYTIAHDIYDEFHEQVTLTPTLN